MASGIFNEFKSGILKAVYNLSSHTIKIALVRNYTFAPADSGWASVAPYEVAGNGYTPGGQALTNKAVTQDNTNDRATFGADNPSWSDATFSADGAIVYDDTASGDPLICFVDFGAPQFVSRSTFTVSFSGGVILRLVSGTGTYNEFCAGLLQGAFALNFGSALSVKAAWVSEAYSFDADHAGFATVSPHRVTTPTSMYLDPTYYVAAGSVGQDDVGNKAVWDGTDLETGVTSFAARYVVLYQAADEKLICCFDAGSPLYVSNGFWSNIWDSGGILQIT